MIPDFLAPFAAQLEEYKVESIKIKATPLAADRVASADSKFRGLPLLPLTVPYPVDKGGNPLLLLAQINLQELPSNAFLPTNGLLQFYVAAHDWYDMEQSAVLYLRPEQMQAPIREDYGFLPANHYEESPIYCEHQLTFERAVEYGSAHDERFKARFNGMDSYDYAETLPKAEQKLFEQFLDGDGHKLGGYSSFTQGDPREIKSNSVADVQLLQIDVDEEIMFGDSGVAHFFIAKQALNAGRFEEAYFYWDCC